MSLTPQFLTLTRRDGTPVTVALAHIVWLSPEREPSGTAHDDDCPEAGAQFAECVCRWTWENSGTRIALTGNTDLLVREQHDAIVALMNERMAAVIDAAGLIARNDDLADAAFDRSVTLAEVAARG